MLLEKCPRCELNYILDDGEKLCRVCRRDLLGEKPHEEQELCSICNEAPALPGKDVCLACLKEMSGHDGDTIDSQEETTVDPSSIDIDPVSSMDEIIPDIQEDMASPEYGEIRNELSLETVLEDEERQADKDEDEEEEE